MKQVNGATPVNSRSAARARGGRTLTLAFSSALLLAVVPAGPASAACVQSGNIVTCSGASVTGFGTGLENNLTLTVQPGGSITATNVINLGSGNTVTNNGAIVAFGVVGGIGMQGVGNNVFTNAGTMSLGFNSIGIYAPGDNNIITNSGTISSTAPNIFGIYVSGGTGNIVTNSGTINLTGVGSFGIVDEGFASTVTNSGTITIGGGSFFGGDGVTLGTNSKLTNSGTITTAADGGSGVSMSGGSTVINNGLIGSIGRFGAGVWINGTNSTIVNNGTITGSAAGYSLRSVGGNGNSITNNGTLDGQISILGTGNSLINAGLITITDPGIALATGNLSFAGTFTQTAQGTLALRVDSTGLHDGLFAVNQVNLNGTLRPVLTPGLFGAPITYKDIVTTNAAVVGQFANISAPSAFFNAVAAYNAQSVDLTISRNGFGNVAGETVNQRSIGNALESGYSTALTGATATFYARLLQAASLRVLDQLSGEGTSGTQNTAFNAASLFGRTMDGQMEGWRAGNRNGAGSDAALGYAAEQPHGTVSSAFAALKAPALAQPQWNAWGAGFGAGQSLSGNANIGSAGLSDRAAGGSIGVDHLVNPDLLIGIAAGGSSATFSVADRTTSGRLEGGHIGAYAMQRFGLSYLSAQIAYSHFNNSTTRTISGVGPDETAKGSFGSDQFGGRLEIGRAFAFGNVSVTPFAAVQAARLWQGAYTETSTAGAAPGVLGLSYASHAASSLPTFLGAKFDGRVDFGNGMVWSPFVHAAWVHEFEPSRTITASLVTVPVPAFTISGASAASDSARVDLGSRLALNRVWELSGRVTGEFSNLGQTYSGIGSLRASW
jgi:uncharacterized protein with beta-barrel porin domain